MEQGAEAESSNELQRLKELHEQALDDIQSKDEQTKVSGCLLEETMETPEPGEGSTGSRVEVQGSVSNGYHSRAGNPCLGHGKTGTQWMPKG